MKKIIVFSYYSPSEEHAGGQRILDLYSELRNIQPNVHLTIVVFGETCVDMKSLGLIFNEVYNVNQKKLLPKHLSTLCFSKSDFDVIDLQYHQAGRLIKVLRNRWPSAKIIFSPMESQLRALLMAIKGKNRKFTRSWRNIFGLVFNSVNEVIYVLAADKVITVSHSDQKVLSLFKKVGNVSCLPTCLSTRANLMSNSIDLSEDDPIIVFFAYFASKTNQDALYWFVNNVHPIICKAVPRYHLRIVGHGINACTQKLCDTQKIEVIGPVSSIQDALQGAMVGIAPALSGAGVRGKIHQYAAFGLPCVASPIACQGLLYEDGESICVATHKREFAQACITLLQDRTLRRSISKKAMAVCQGHYQWHLWHNKMEYIYELAN